MNELTRISISRFQQELYGEEQISLDDDICVVNIKGRARATRMNFPFRFDGILLIWCIEGELSISVDLAEYGLNDNTLFLCLPGSILKLNQVEGDESHLHYVCMAISKEFVSSQKMDMSKVFSTGLSLLDDPRLKISDTEAAFMATHLETMGDIARSELQHKRECMRALWTSMLYIIASVLDSRKTEVPEVRLSGSRSRVLFEQFMELVSKYHDRHRTVGFYADKLCLTPKYLSKLIKNATGRSAPEWIDAYVILEAKNLLKYSDCTIKEIVYKLNFPNQSVFYKFFKARTGMTPSEYRKS